MTETSAKATSRRPGCRGDAGASGDAHPRLSDRAIAWLFIAPTIVLLLAINIFPLIWTIYLSFTNYKANRPNAPILGVGTTHYSNILTDPDIWHSMQVTAHFVFWTVALETLIGFTPRLSDRPAISAATASGRPSSSSR